MQLLHCFSGHSGAKRPSLSLLADKVVPCTWREDDSSPPPTLAGVLAYDSGDHSELHGALADALTGPAPYMNCLQGAAFGHLACGWVRAPTKPPRGPTSRRRAVELPRALITGDRGMSGWSMVQVMGRDVSRALPVCPT